MCDIKIISVDGNTETFTATFESCEGNEGFLNASLVSTSASSGSASYVLKGQNTSSEDFLANIEVPESARINPTKVFKYIAKKLKDILCPECV